MKKFIILFLIILFFNKTQNVFASSSVFIVDNIEVGGSTKTTNNREKYLKSNAKRPENFQSNGRGYPDVSAIGHNCPVVVNGVPMNVDGTSCSSPVFASIISLLNDYQIANGKSKLGFINPVLYKMYNDNPKIFNDITKGNNWCTENMCCNSTFGYEAWIGWDPVTGLGTPNVGLMIEWLNKNT